MVHEVQETADAHRLAAVLAVTHETFSTATGSRERECNIFYVAKKLQSDPVWLTELLAGTDLALDLVGLARVSGIDEQTLKKGYEKRGFKVRARFARTPRFSLVDVSTMFKTSPLAALRFEQVSAKPEEHVLTKAGWQGED